MAWRKGELAGDWKRFIHRETNGKGITPNACYMQILCSCAHPDPYYPEIHVTLWTDGEKSEHITKGALTCKRCGLMIPRPSPNEKG